MRLEKQDRGAAVAKAMAAREGSCFVAKAAAFADYAE